MKVEKILQFSCETKIRRMIHNSLTNSVFLLLENGKVEQYLWKSEKPQLIPFITFPTACSYFKSIFFSFEDTQKTIEMNESGIKKLKGIEALVGLDQRSKLYVNETLISNECSSFIISEKFLLWTTITNTIRCVSLHGLTKPKGNDFFF